MLTKQDLNKYHLIEAEVRYYDRLINQLREQAQTPRITQITGMPRGKGTGVDPVAEYMANIDTLIRKYESSREDLYKLRSRIEDALEALEPNERLVIRLKYLERREWISIGMEMHYTARHAQRIHVNALKKLMA